MTFPRVSASKVKPINLTVDPAQFDIAIQLSNTINAEVSSGVLTPERPNGIGAPVLTSGHSGELIIQQSSFVVLPPGYVAIVADANAITLLGDGQHDQTVLSDGGSLSFTTGGGSGTVVASGGNNRIVTSGDGWNISLGNGRNTLEAITGAVTLAAGAGQNDIQLGSGTAVVDTSGRDQIQGGSGAATVNVQAGAQAYFNGGQGTLLFIDTGAGSTVVGGSGTETIFGARGDYSGGSDGDNLIYGSGTLTGGGAGDQLFATGQGNTLLRAAGGNETLSAALSTGADTLVSGSGNDTSFAGSGRDVFQFNHASGGGSILVHDFTGSDTIHLVGYGADEASKALAGAQVTASGTTLQLSDNTNITFTGVTDLTELHFR